MTQPKKLSEFTVIEFDILKRSGLLNNIYPDAPERFEDIPVEKPEVIKNPDWSPLVKMVSEYIDTIGDEDKEREFDSGYTHEAVVTAMYGSSFFNWFNQATIFR